MVPSDLNVPLAGGASAPQRQDLLRQQLKRDLREQLDVVVTDLVAPGRHGRRLAVEHRIAEALEIILGKLAQIEGHAAGATISQPWQLTQKSS
jgi:hypothetical protein